MSYPQSTRMTWNPGVPGIKDHPVRIVGVAFNGLAVLGITYIVELLEPLPNFSYSHVTAFDCHLKEPTAEEVLSYQQRSYKATCGIYESEFMSDLYHSRDTK